MAAYDTVSLPGAPNIATAGNYAQMLFNMGQSLGEDYQKGQQFQYEQRMRNLYQDPQKLADLQEALRTGNYAGALAPIIQAGGASTGAQVVAPLAEKQMLGQILGGLNRPWPELGGTPGATPTPSAIRPAPSSATGPGGITGRSPDASPGETVQTMTAQIASSKPYLADLDIPPSVINMWAREQFGLSGPEAPLPEAARGKLSSLIDSYAAAKGINVPGRIPIRSAGGGGGPPGTGGSSIPSGPGAGPGGPSGGLTPSPPSGPTGALSGAGAPVAPAPIVPRPVATVPAAPMAPPGPAPGPVVAGGPAPGPVAGPAAPGAGPARPAIQGLPDWANPYDYDRARLISAGMHRQALDMRQRAERLNIAGGIMGARGAGQALIDQANKIDDQAKFIEEQLKPSAAEMEASRQGMTPLQQKMAEERNKLAAVRYDRLQTSNAAIGRSADEMAGHLQVMHSVLESPDLFTGPGHEPVEYLRKATANFMPQWIRSGLGITATTAPNEALRKVTAANVLSQTNMLRDDASAIGGSGGAVRVAQIDLMQKAAQSGDSSIPALRLLTELGDRAVVQGKVIARMTQDYARAHGGLDVNFERQMSDWYERHPLLSPEEEHDIRYLSAPRVPASVKTSADAIKWAKQLGLKPGDPVRSNRTTLQNFDRTKPGEFPAQYTSVPPFR